MSVRLTNDREIDAMAAHLSYHAREMARQCGWTRRFARTGPAELERACLEATMVHLRLLTEFLAGRPTSRNPANRHWSPKDLTPGHLLDDWQGLRERQRLDPYLSVADEYVAHLSTIRAQTLALIIPPVEHVVGMVLDEFADFIEAVEATQDRASTALRDGLTDARELLADLPTLRVPDLVSPTTGPETSHSGS